MYKTDAARGIMGGVGNNARLLWYDPTSASISNPPAQNVKWSVKYYDNQTIEELTDPKKHSTMELMGNPLPLPHHVDFYPNVLHSEVFLRVEIQPLKAFDRQVDNQELKLKEWIKSLRAFDGRKQLFGYVDFAVGIPEKRGEGLGQAAYLKAAQELSKYGIPLLSTNSSAKADRAWESLERNLPPGFKIATMTNWEEARTNPRFKDKITKLFTSEWEKELARSFKSGKSYDTRMPARADSLSYARRIEAEGPDNLMRYLSTNSELDFATGKEQLSEKNLGSGAQGTFYSGYAETTYSGLLNRLLRRKAKRTPVSLGVTMSPKDIANTARDLTASLARNVEVTDSVIHTTDRG